MFRLMKFCLCLMIVLTASQLLSAADKNLPEESTVIRLASFQKPNPKQAFTDVKSAGPEFAYTGEYIGYSRTVNYCQQRMGLQVYALGDARFAARQYLGGLPGDRWTEKSETPLEGRVEGNNVVLEAPSIRFIVSNSGHVAVQDSSGASLGTLQKVQRESQMAGAYAPWGAEVLFRDGKANGLKNPQVSEDGLLMVGTETTKGYQDFTLHVEFRLPYMPYANGQGRANSGVYLQSRYEVQILDSFGLEGKNNECGGLYKQREPDFNMCLPPLTWQTYDINFRAARFDDEGNKVCNARLSVCHNGIYIHNNVELTSKTGAGKKETPEALPIKFQNHGNPVHFRNIWIVDHSSRCSNNQLYTAN